MTDEYKGLVPYLFYDDIESTMAWYERVFGFVETGCWKNDDGIVQNAEMRVGNTELWLDGGGRRSQDSDDTRPTWIGVWVDDPDAMFERVRQANVPCDPPVTREFGVRMLTVSDPEGYLWGFMR